MLQSVGTNHHENKKIEKKGIDERLTHLEEDVRDLDKSLKDEHKKPEVRPIPPPPPPVVVPNLEIPENKPIEKTSSAEKPLNTNNRCTWRN
ncbi:unnamed protein product, partial [Rotaria socialis]